MFQGGQTGLISLTAYILIALAEANSNSRVSCGDMVMGMKWKGVETVISLSFKHYYNQIITQFSL